MDNYGKYTLDYLGKYYFYEEEEFLEVVDNAEFILQKLKEGNRFDYDGASYTYTKYNNISRGVTERDVEVVIERENINVKINGESVHLDLNYKFQIKDLEDHTRVTTRISGKGENISCLMYIDYKQKKEFLEALEYVKGIQEKWAEKKD